MAVGDPPITNAVVSVYRNNLVVANLAHVNVYIKAIGAQNLDFQGVPISFDVLGGYNAAAPGTWRINDVLRLESFSAAEVLDYTVKAILGFPIGPIPLWHVRIAGYIR